MALTTQIKLSVIAALTGTAGDFATPRSDLNYEKTLNLGNGTTAGLANEMWHDQRTISDGGNEDLDFAGSLTGQFGNTLTFTKLKYLVFYAAAANTTDLTVTRPATNGVPFLLAAGDGFLLRPNSLVVMGNQSAAAWAVTAGTGDLINVANAAGAAATYDVIAIGTNS